MVADPELCRLNGAKSKGPVSERGKAIASQNATKHGLLSERPPLVVGEDLETFQGIVQGLIDEYEPSSASEHLLVQQLAMAWLRLHRLWGVEAATANQASLRIERSALYPSERPDDTVFNFHKKSAVHPDVLKEERRILHLLDCNVDDWIVLNLPTRDKQQWAKSAAAKKAKRQLLDYISEASEKYPPDALLGLDPDERDGCMKRRIAGFYVDVSDWRPNLGVGLLKERAETIVSECQQRLKEIDSILTDIKRMEKETQLATLKALAIPEQSDRLMRYERHITKQLHDALDRLQSIQQQRQEAGSMGSFG